MVRNSLAQLTRLMCVLRYFVKVNLFNCGICTGTVGRNPCTYVGEPKPNKFFAFFIHKFRPSGNSMSGNSYLNTKAKMTFYFIHGYKKLEFTRHLKLHLSKFPNYFMLFEQVCWSCKRFGNNCHTHIFVVIKWHVLGYGSCRSENKELFNLRGGSLLPPA